MAQDAQIPLECIVVDDRGTDNSMAVVNRLVDAYQGPIEFRIVTREKNGGLSAARNSGIDVARGEYLYFLDSDDTITPDAIRLLWQQVEAHPCVDMVVGTAKCFPTPDMDEYLDLSKFKLPEYNSQQTKSLAKVFLQLPEIACSKLFRVRFILDNCLTFKEGIVHEDFHQHLRITKHIQSFAISETVTYNYRMRPGSIMKECNEVLRQKQVFEIFADIVSSGYNDTYLLQFILSWVERYRIMVDTAVEWRKIRKTYISCIQRICTSLPISQAIPFRYLQMPRPWMRFKVLHKLADLCWK
jgi:glycosyltransferase involved in cell wall biosynthesis